MTSDDDDPMPKSRLSWFANGMGMAVLLFAAINSLSYFWRTPDWWFGLTSTGGQQAVGFPLRIWSRAQSYPGLPLDPRGTLVNAIVGLTFAFAVGFACAASTKVLNRFLSAMLEGEQQGQGVSWQFSLKGMLVVTAIAAVVATLIRLSFGPRPGLLVAIYFLGPLFLIGLAMIPRGLNWQSRIVLLVPSTILLIAYAVYVGNKLGLELDRIMFGVYIVWVPQTVLAATALLIYHFWKFQANNRNDKNLTP